MNKVFFTLLLLVGFVACTSNEATPAVEAEVTVDSTATVDTIQ